MHTYIHTYISSPLLSLLLLIFYQVVGIVRVTSIEKEIAMDRFHWWTQAMYVCIYVLFVCMYVLAQRHTCINVCKNVPFFYMYVMHVCVSIYVCMCSIYEPTFSVCMRQCSLWSKIRLKNVFILLCNHPLHTRTILYTHTNQYTSHISRWWILYYYQASQVGKRLPGS